MKNVKKIAALGLSATMAMGMLPATLVSADEATGTVYKSTPKRLVCR